jgi:hypothetical protein
MEYCEPRAPGPPGSAAGSRGVSDPAQLTRIMNEVPLVVGVKQSAGDLKLFATPGNYAVLYRNRIAVG